MANILKQISLTDKGLGAGPYFDIYFSLDCVNYTLAGNGANVYLPSTTSSAVVVVDEGLTCLKVVNRNPKCFFNDVVQTFTTTTTTSTTSTTTTTLAPLVLYRITYNNQSTQKPGFTFIDFNNTLQSQDIYTLGNTFRFIARKGSVVDVAGGMTLTILQEPIVPTFTSYTINKTSGNGLTAYTYQLSDGTTNFVSESPGGYSRTYCNVTDTLIKTYDPLNKLSIVTGSACNTTTTSTTSTTTTACTSITFDGNITHAGLTAYWTDCDGTARSQFVPADTTYGPVCVRTGTASGQAFTVNGSCDTSTTTTTTAAPTTTTTTIGTFSGNVCYGNNASDACNNPISCFSMQGDGTTFCNSTVFTGATWYSIPTGNYVVSYGGNAINVSHTQFTSTATVYGGGCQACPATTTTSTTTTTAAPTATANWEWTNNNTVDYPIGGGYITITKNGSNVVYQSDNGPTTTTFSGSFGYAPGDSIGVTVYTYANTNYGTDTNLIINNPVATQIYNQSDTQPNPGSPSSLGASFTSVAGGITITAASNSY